MKKNRPRHGSLQFWPRSRTKRAFPRVNWEEVISHTPIQGIQGIIGYKVGMATSIVKDNTDKSLIKGKKVALPSTILEIPPLKIFSVRFYKNGIVLKEFIVAVDKTLKRKLKIPKTVKQLDTVNDYDDIRVIMFSQAKTTGLKKSPDLFEAGINAPDKLSFVKENIGKDLYLTDLLKNITLLDSRAATKGKGFQGPVKRYGVELRAHKSEKGIRKVGSLGPWHPAHVSFRVPMAGQLGMFNRVTYNLRVLSSGNIKNKNINKKGGFKNYGLIKGDYIILKGSVQGPQKRPILLTPSIRPTKMQSKKQYEFIGLS